MHASLSSLILLSVMLASGLSSQASAAVDQPVLDMVEPRLITDQVTVGGGASIKLPREVAYISWQELQRFLILSPSGIPSEDPVGVIISLKSFDLLSDRRASARSRDDWELYSTQALLSYGIIQVLWEEGWIDTSEKIPESGKLLADLQLQAQVINNRHLMGPGISLSFDGWGQEPAFNAQQGILTASIHMGLQVQGLGPNGRGKIFYQAYHTCHLGAKGVLRLLCEEGNSPEYFDHKLTTTERMKQISEQVTWSKNCTFTTTRPADVGERTRGLRGLMQPRLFFGNTKDELDYHQGLGVAWILLILPIGIVIFLVVRWIKGIAKATTRTTAAAQNVATRCPACGSQISTSTPRCLSCGTSLIRRQG